MKLEVRVHSRNEAEDRLAADPEVGARYDHRSIVELDADSPDLRRMIELTRDTDGLSLTPIFTFTARETAQAPFVEMRPRKVLATGERDTELNEAHNDGLPLRGSPPGGVRLMERFVSSKGKAPAAAVMGAGEFGNEFVAGVHAAQVFRSASVPGLELRPVFTSRGEPRQDVLHLFTQALAPPVLREEGVVSRRGDPGNDPEAQMLGALVYTPEALAQMPSEVVRTREPFAEWDHPLWLLSARVARLLQQEKVTGVTFVPVLEAGSPVHAEYVRRWRGLVALMAANPRNSF